MKILNYMHALYIDETKIYVSGGLNHEKNFISNKAYIYNAKFSTADKLPDMIRIRYAHSGLFLNNRLYIVGGR